MDNTELHIMVDMESNAFSDRISQLHYNVQWYVLHKYACLPSRNSLWRNFQCEWTDCTLNWSKRFASFNQISLFFRFRFCFVLFNKLMQSILISAQYMQQKHRARNACIVALNSRNHKTNKYIYI